MSDVKQSRTFWWQRTTVIVGLVLYVACFNWMYVHYLYPTWRYFGYDYDPPQAKALIVTWVASLLPSLWMPMTVRRPSQLAYWVLYFTVIIPSMFVPLYAGLSSANQVLPLVLCLLVGFAITGMSYGLPLPKVRPPSISPRSFWLGFGAFAAFITLIVLVAFRSAFSIVSFSDIYDVRYAAGDVMNGTGLNYPLMWLYGAINPFMMGYGLYSKRWALVLVGALGQILVYGSLGTKASLLSIVFMCGFYLLLKDSRFPFGLKITWSILTLVGVVCYTCVSTDGEVGLLQTGLSYVVLMRSFSYCGLLTAQYLNFFAHNPFTYYSHIKGVNWFVSYPFHYPLGTEIGYYYYDPLCDTTAHFWATDGIAALGIPGILVASLLCGCLFWLIDTASQRHSPRLAALVIAYAAYNLGNLSMFTTFLSGGLGLLVLFLYLMPPSQPRIYGPALARNLITA